MIFLIYILVGMVAGTFAGLFGIGGGLILVPTFVYVLKLQGVSSEIAIHIAIATSLACIIPVAISSSIAHHKQKSVNWAWVIPMSFGMIFGAFLGAKTALSIEGSSLEILIGIFAILVALKMFFGLKPIGSKPMPSKGVLALFGAGIAWLSAIIGIGGGTVSVPFLLWRGASMHRAVGTSAALGMPIAIFGALTNMFMGWGNSDLPEWSVGYVYLPALVGILLTSVLFSRLGVMLAHNLSQKVLTRIFAIFLLCIGISFLV